MRKWIRRFLGLDRIEESISRQSEQQQRFQEDISERLRKLQVQVADLRQHLDLDPMVDLRQELADYTRGGDPMLGS